MTALCSLLRSHEDCCVFAAVINVGWLKRGGLLPRLYVCQPAAASCDVQDSDILTQNTKLMSPIQIVELIVHQLFMQWTACLRKQHLDTRVHALCDAKLWLNALKSFRKDNSLNPSMTFCSQTHFPQQLISTQLCCYGNSRGVKILQNSVPLPAYSAPLMICDQPGVHCNADSAVCEIEV